MKEANKNLIESIMVENLEDFIPYNEIRNSIDIMSSVKFDNSTKIDKEKLEDALNKAYKYLTCIVLSSSVVAVEAIYKEQLRITMNSIKKSLV